MSTPSAEREPPMAEASQEAQRDILDTTDAGPAVIRGSLLRFGGYGLGTLVTVASSAVVIRHLGVVDTGHYTTVTALVLIISTISDLGLTGIAVREYAARPKSDSRRFLRNLLGIRVVLAFGGLALAVLFGLLVGYPAVMVIGTAIAGAGTVVLVIQDGCTIPLQVGLRFGWVAGLQLAVQVAVAIEAVLLVLAGAGLLPFFAMLLPVAIPALLVTVLVGGRDSRLIPRIDTREWRQMVGRILPYSVAVVLSVVYFQIAQVMVSVLSNSHETGYFGVSFRVLVAFATLPPLLVSTALPLLARAARDDEQRFNYASRRLAETLMIAGCGLTLALFLGAGFAVPVVGGHGFRPSIDVLRILAFALLGTFVIGARGYTLLSLDRLRPMLVSNAVALAVVVLCGVPLIRAYGAQGAAIAMVAAELTLALCYEWSLSRWRPDSRLAVGFVLRAAAAMLVGGAVPVALGLAPLPAAVLGAAIYTAGLAALGIIPAELRDALLQRRRPAV
jgi:O-antigen/teichoic acid export membrane protein